MLCGAKVSRLLPFLQQKGFNADARTTGGEALAALRAAPCHLLLLELELGDLMAVELAKTAKDDHLAGACLLVDDGARSGMIVSALARGIDSFVAIPPDEKIFFERIEGMLLAQWGLVVVDQQQRLVDEVAGSRHVIEELKKDVESEKQKRADLELEKAAELAEQKKRIDELERETRVLRDQLATMHLVTGAKSGMSDEGNAIDDELASLIDMSAGAEDGDDEVEFFMPETNSGTDDLTGTIGDDGDGDGLADFDANFDGGGNADDDAFNERTQAIPEDLARSLLAGDATRPSMAKATLPDTPASDAGDDDFNFDDVSGAELADFDALGVSDNTEDIRNDFSSENDAATRAFGAETDGATAAMPAALARKLIEGVGASSPAPLDAFDTPTLQSIERPGAAPGFLDDFDAPTMSIPRDVAAELIKNRQAPSTSDTQRAAQRTAPRPAFADSDDDLLSFEDEKTPVAGMSAPAVPAAASFGGNDENTAPGGFDVGLAPGQKPQRVVPQKALDSQVIRDLNHGIPSADADEILFIDDE